MTCLVRENIKNDFRKSKSVNPSLLLQKGMLEVENSDDKSNNKKSEHLKKIVKLPAPAEYEKAFHRWVDLTSDVNRFNKTVMTIENRLLIGLTGNGVLETGCSLSHNYGMPYIPGSSVKGVVRAWADGKNLSDESKSTLEQLFGTYDSDQPNRVSGTVTFHDAWWIPQEDNKPFVLDVVTTHHQDYYNGKKDKDIIPPSDKDSPIPIHLLAVKGRFLFVLEGDPESITICQTMLKRALTENGIGAKTAAGYGYFKKNDHESLNLFSNLQKSSSERLMTEEEKPAHEISELTEDQLIQMFSKDLNKTKARKDFDILVKKIRELHHDVISSWETATKNTSKNRHKAYQFLLGSHD